MHFLAQKNTSKIRLLGKLHLGMIGKKINKFSPEKNITYIWEKMLFFLVSFCFCLYMEIKR